MIRWIRQQLRPLVSFWQRGRRGWADEDTWGLSNYLAEVIAGSVGYLRKRGIGFQCVHDLNYDQHDCTPEGWENVLQRIEFGMRYWQYAEDHELDDITFDYGPQMVAATTAGGVVFPKIGPDNWLEISNQRAARRDEIMRLALDLMAKYWPGLWD